MKFIQNPLLIVYMLAGLIGFSQNSVEVINPSTMVYKTIDTISLKLHIYKPKNFDTSKRYNCVTFFHGGGWNTGSPKAFRRQSMYFASRGMIAISAEYRLKNTHGTTPFEATEDAKSAIRFVRQHAKQLNVNPNAIIAGGGSAGGHLAASCGLISKFDNPNEDLSISSVPNALILLNPVIDLGPGAYAHKRIGNRFLDLSPTDNITEGAPPSIILVGTNDRIISVDMVKAFKQKMEAVGSRCDLILYKDQDHAFFAKKPIKYFIDTTHEIDKFLISLGYLSGESTINDQYFKLNKNN